MPQEGVCRLPDISLRYREERMNLKLNENLQNFVLTNEVAWPIIATNKKPVIEKSNRSVFVDSEPRRVQAR